MEKYAIILPIILLIAIPCVGILLEWRYFNKGVCPKCGGDLKYFDSTFGGDRGYTCENHANNCHYTAWVSYNCVDRGYR